MPRPGDIWKILTFSPTTLPPVISFPTVLKLVFFQTQGKEGCWAVPQISQHRCQNPLTSCTVFSSSTAAGIVRTCLLALSEAWTDLRNLQPRPPTHRASLILSAESLFSQIGLELSGKMAVLRKRKDNNKASVGGVSQKQSHISKSNCPRDKGRERQLPVPSKGTGKRQPHPWVPVYFLSETCPSLHAALSHRVITGPRTLHAILCWKYQIVPRRAENVFPHGDHFIYSTFEFLDFCICNRWCFYSILQFISHFPLQSALTLVTHQWEV